MPANVEVYIQEEDYIEEGSSGIASEDDEIFAADIKTTTDDIDKAKTFNKRNTATFTSLPDKDIHEDFIRKSIDIILKEAVFDGTSRENRVLQWRNPAELQEVLDLHPRESPSTHEELLRLLSDTIQCSVKTGHPFFVNQLFSSLDPYGLVAQWVGDALNPSVYTFEVAPVFTLMEEIVLTEMRRIVGYVDGAGDGIFCPGGSIANGYAISCARYKYCPDIKSKGLHGLPRLVLFTSEDAHYSIKKMASFLGIGSDNVYLIRTDAKGRMSLEHLEEQVDRALAEGAAPFMVSATAATTVLGAFDPIEGLADLCARRGLWLHVDAAWGGGALMSKQHRYRLQGIHRADSVTWNPHKLLAVPQQCSTLLVKHQGILAACHNANAAYLFQKDKFYDTSFDTGDKHIQCGRRADVLKFWYMWKAKGTSGMEKHVDKVMDNASFFVDNIKERPGFRMVLEDPEFTNICFWYVPPSLRDAEDTPDFNERLHKVAPKMKERMMKEGSMMVTYQAQKGLPNFFRIVFQNSALDHDDMLHFISEFERLGSDL